MFYNILLHIYREGELKHSKHEYRGSPLGENIAGKTSTGAVTEYTGQTTSQLLLNIQVIQLLNYF